MSDAKSGTHREARPRSVADVGVGRNLSGYTRTEIYLGGIYLDGLDIFGRYITG